MPDLRETVLQHIQCSHAALEAANTQLTKVAEVQKQAAELIPQVVEELVKHDRIDPAQREKAAELLKDPVQALKILLKTADANNTVKPKALGTPTGAEKVAGASRPRYTGERTSEKTAADLAFERTLLGQN